MVNAYNVLKFVHVLSVIAWIGGACLSVLVWRVMELARVASSEGANDQSLAEAGGKLWTVQLIYLAIMASVVGAMVLKPTL